MGDSCLTGAFISILFVLSNADVNTENEIVLNLMEKFNMRQCVLVSKSGSFESLKFFSSRNVGASSHTFESLPALHEGFSKVPAIVVFNIDYEWSHFERLFLVINQFILGSKSVLVIFTKPGSINVSDLKPVQLSYNVEFFIVEKIEAASFLIKEVYAYKKVTWMNAVGSWKDDRLFFPVASLYKRRGNMTGIILGTKSYETLCPALKVDCEHVYVWKDLQKTFNFETVLSDEEFDVMIKPLPYTDTMAEFVMGPVFRLRTYMYFRQPQEFHSWTSYFRPFHLLVWTAIVGWLIVCCVSFQMTSAAQTNNLTVRNRVEVFGIGFSALYSFCNQDGNRKFDDSSRRIILLMARIVGLIMVVHYSATLMSFLTITRFQIPFHNVRGLLNQKQYQIGLINNSFTAVNLMMTSPWAWTITVHLNVYNAIDRICAENIVLLSEEAVPTNTKCKLKRLKSGLLDSYTGLYVADKGLRAFFNKMLISFRTAGVTDRMYAQFEWKKIATNPDKLVEVDFAIIFPLLIFIGSFVGIACIVLVIELLMNKFTEKNLKTKKFNKKIFKPFWLKQPLQRKRFGPRARHVMKRVRKMVTVYR